LDFSPCFGAVLSFNSSSSDDSFYAFATGFETGKSRAAGAALALAGAASSSESSPSTFLSTLSLTALVSLAT